MKKVCLKENEKTKKQKKVYRVARNKQRNLCIRGLSSRRDYTDTFAASDMRTETGDKDERAGDRSCVECN